MSNHILAVSVIIVEYNSTWSRLRNTLKSLLLQEDIEYEIIIADDGSKNNWFDEIKLYFRENSFKQYKLFSSEKNNGTCQNLYRVLSSAEGQYIKTISPGDYLYNPKVLSRWYEYVSENQIKVSFGAAIYYQANKDNLIVIKRRSPCFYHLYEYSNYKHYSAKVTSFLFLDAILGAALLVEKKILQKYLKEIVNGGVKLGDDFILRIMMLDNIKICYYPENVIWYEYGLGVSTSGNPVWIPIMFNDLCCMFRIESMLEKKDFFYRKYRLLIPFLYGQKIYNKIIRKMIILILFPEVLFWYAYKRIRINSDKISYDEKEFYKITDKIFKGL